MSTETCQQLPRIVCYVNTFKTGAGDDCVCGSWVLYTRDDGTDFSVGRMEEILWGLDRPTTDSGPDMLILLLTAKICGPASCIQMQMLKLNGGRHLIDVKVSLRFRFLTDVMLSDLRIWHVLSTLNMTACFINVALKSKVMFGRNERGQEGPSGMFGILNQTT